MIQLRVFGAPAPQGSKKAIVIKGKARVIEQSDARIKTWRGDVIDAATRWAEEHPDETLPLDAPFGIECRLSFFLPRPKSIPRRRVYPTVQPDIDKLARATLDPLMIAGVIRDDAEVVRLFVGKSYAETSAVSQGCLIELEAM